MLLSWQNQQSSVTIFLRKEVNSVRDSFDAISYLFGRKKHNKGQKMVKSCAAIHCKNRQGGEKSCGNCESLSFHSFPIHDPSRLQQWVSALKRDQWVPNQYSAVCSEHFKPTDFIYCPNGKKRRLKPEAVPSYFKVPHHSHKQQHQERQTDTIVTDHTSDLIKIRPQPYEEQEEPWRLVKRPKYSKDQSSDFSQKTAKDDMKHHRIKEIKSESHSLKHKVKPIDYTVSSIHNVIDETQKRNLISVEYADFVKFLIKP